MCDFISRIKFITGIIASTAWLLHPLAMMLQLSRLFMKFMGTVCVICLELI